MAEKASLQPLGTSPVGSPPDPRESLWVRGPLPLGVFRETFSAIKSFRKITPMKNILGNS
jgi:hypothetical protein